MFFQNSSSTLQWQSPLAKSLHLSDQCLMIGGLLEVISCVRAILAEPHRRCLLLSWNFLCRFCSNSLDTCSETLYKGFCMNFTPQLVLKLRPSLPLDLDVFDVCHCLPIFALLPRSVMKNCEPFVSGPVLAMDSSIGLEWRTTWRSWNVHFWNEQNPNNILLKSS